MIRTAVLPFGRAGMISASMLGLGRALGETIAVALVLNSGFTINWHHHRTGRRHVRVDHRAEVRRGRRQSTRHRRADPGRPVPVRDHPGGQLDRADGHRPQEGVHRMTEHLSGDVPLPCRSFDDHQFQPGRGPAAVLGCLLVAAVADRPGVGRQVGVVLDRLGDDVLHRGRAVRRAADRLVVLRRGPAAGQGPVRLHADLGVLRGRDRAAGADPRLHRGQGHFGVQRHVLHPLDGRRDGVHAGRRDLPRDHRHADAGRDRHGDRDPDRNVHRHLSRGVRPRSSSPAASPSSST